MAAGKKLYTVAISNAFAGLNSDEDSDGEVAMMPPKTENSEKPARVQKTTEVSKKPQVQQANRPNRGPVQEQAARQPERTQGGSPPSRGRGDGRGGRFGGGPEGRGRGPRRDFQSERVQDPTAEPQHGEGQRRETRGRGRGGRVYDRHSQTGRGGGYKKGGGGGHNWGNETEDFGAKNDAAPQSPQSPSETEKEVKPKEEGADTPAQEGEKPQEKEEVGEREIGYEEYLLQLEAKRANLPSFVRTSPQGKVFTETELTAEGYEKYVKEGSSSDEEDEVESDEESNKPKKKAVNVYEYMHSEGCHFPSYRGRGRGGRGGSRRGGGSERPPQQRIQKDAPNLQDPHAFPSLG